MFRLCAAPTNPATDLLVESRREGERLERRLVRLQTEIARLPECPVPQPQDEAAAPQCPPQRPTDVVLVVDVSISMGLNFDADPEMIRERLGPIDDERIRLIEEGTAIEDRLARASLSERIRLSARLEQINRRLEVLDREYDAEFEPLTRAPGIDRIDVAKDALTRLVTDAPDDVVLTALEFARCGRPNLIDRATAGERQRLISRIAGLDLHYNTALGQAIRHIRDHTDGGVEPDAPVNVVLFSDGDDTCGFDPCAEAAALKEDRPFLYVNVVAIGRESLDIQQCIASATGGMFLQAEEAGELADQMQRASGQERDERCP